MFKASKAMRFFFFNTSMVCFLSIWLTGFTTAHWTAYIVPVFTLFAAITALCPGLIMAKKIFGED